MSVNKDGKFQFEITEPFRYVSKFADGALTVENEEGTNKKLPTKSTLAQMRNGQLHPGSPPLPAWPQWSFMKPDTELILLKSTGKVTAPTDSALLF